MIWPVATARAAAVTAVAAAVLQATAATPRRAVAELSAGLSAGGDPFAPLVSVAALGAWLLAAWLTATLALTWAGRLPGLLGRLCGRASRCIAPRTVRRAVEVALGLSLASGAAWAGPASAAPLSGSGSSVPVAAQAPSLDWPTRPLAVGMPLLDWPTAPPAASPTPPEPTPSPGPEPTPEPALEPAPELVPARAGVVVVQPGDSLWSLAEQSLGPGATTAQVAQAWPAWWAANRDVVGDDPHLLSPGDRLVPPAR